MKLTILDRIIIMQILPAESDISTLRIVRDMKKKLGFSTEETEKFNIKNIVEPNTGRSSITWDAKAMTEEVDIKLVRVEREIIINAIDELDKKKKALEIHIDIYDKVKNFNEEVEKQG